MLRVVMPSARKGAFQRRSVTTFLSAMNAYQRRNDIAIVVDKSKEFTYDFINKQSSLLASRLVQLEHVTSKTKMIAGYNKPSIEYVVTMVAAWKLGKVFLPLSPEHTESEINYFVDDSSADVLINSDSSPIGFDILSRNKSFKIVSTTAQRTFYFTMTVRTFANFNTLPAI